MIVAGDIGATNCRLAACEDDGRPVAQHIYPSKVSVILRTLCGFHDAHRASLPSGLLWAGRSCRQSTVQIDRP